MIDARLAPYGAFVLRVALGVMFVAHAYLKLVVFTMPGFAGFLGSVGLPAALAWPIMLAELLGGIAILIGFHARLVAAALLPILLGAEGPKNVALAAEIADGWLPIFLSPSLDVHYRECLAEGFARPGARRTMETFEIPNLVNIVVGDDVEACADVVRMFLGFYIGGMGAKSKNFHTELMARMGFEEDAFKIQDLFFEGKRDEAIMAVPDEFADEISLSGPRERIAERLEAWRKTPVTTLLIGGADPDTMRFLADQTR